jgi:hypothetical protein
MKATRTRMEIPAADPHLYPARIFSSLASLSYRTSLPKETSHGSKRLRVSRKRKNFANYKTTIRWRL